MHYAGSFISTSSHLEPLRAVLDEHLGGDVVLIGTDAGRFIPLPAGSVSFFNQTTTQGSINPLLPLAGTDLDPAYHGTFRIDVLSLPAELTAFTGTVNPLLALGGIAPIPAPPIPLPPLAALRQLLDGFSAHLAGARTDVTGGVTAVSWQAPVPPETPFVPVLQVTLRLETRETVGAPGSARGAGSVLMIDATGRTLGELFVPGTRRLGASVGLPGDLDGDGRTELSVGFEHGLDRSLAALILRQAGQTPPPPTDGPL